MKTKKLTLTALLAAILCILSPWAIPVGPISITLATFAVYTASVIGGWQIGAGAVGIYLILGAVGLPVFSGFAGGFGRIFQVTGGYLVGYLPCALICGLFAEQPWKAWKYPAGMLLGTAVLYGLGTFWYAQCVQVPFGEALLVCVVPFLPGDGIKILMASLIGPRLRKIANQQK